MKVLSISFILLVMVGCGARHEYQVSEQPSPYYSDISDFELPENVVVTAEQNITGRFDGGDQIAEAKRMVTLSATLYTETDSPDSIHQEVQSLASVMGGYLIYSDENRIAVRIPSASLDTFIVKIDEISKIVSRQMSGTDVTNNYYDFKIRLDNATKTRDRYLELLNRANSIEEILRVEKELERLNLEIDSLKGKMARMKNEVDNALVTVYTKPKLKPGPVGGFFYSIYKGLKWLIVR